MSSVEYIKSQLEDGYLNLGLLDWEELQIIREAVEMWECSKNRVTDTMPLGEN